MKTPADIAGLSDPGLRLRKLITLIVVSASTFMLPLDYTIVAVALHDIQRSLDASFVDLQWVINGYTLTFAAFVLASGSLADLFGRRRIFMLGMLVFGASSLASGLAADPLMLNLARGVLGLGAALMFAAALPLLVVEFEGAERAKAFGVFGAVVGIGAALGPFLGGIIISALGWRWAFLVNVPVIVVLMALTFAKVQESKDPNAKGVDWGGLITFTLFCFFFFYAVINGNDAGWSSTSILACFIAAAALLIAFIRIELRHHYPMFDLRLFQSATFVGASTPPIVLSVAFWGPFLYFPMYYQSALGYSPLEAGAAVLPFAIPLFVMGPVGGWLATRISSRALLGLGQLLVGVGALAMLIPTVGATWAAFAAGAFLSGCGAGLINGEMTNIALSLVPPERSGMASGINSTARQVGVAIGFAGLGAVLSHVTAAQFASHIQSHSVTQQLIALVVKGDVTGAAAAAPTALHDIVLSAARLAIYDGFQVIAAVAAVVGIAGAVFSFVTVRHVMPGAPGHAATEAALSSH
jgi:EmrB/QacA subfamily drug resistance transporter